MMRWTPPTATTRKEQMLLKRLTRTKKLFAFLRLHRHELFDDAFQEELESMYRRTGGGREPLPPAVLCMISLLQAYTAISDAEAVELTVAVLRATRTRGHLFIHRWGTASRAATAASRVDPTEARTAAPTAVLSLPTRRTQARCRTPCR